MIPAFSLQIQYSFLSENMLMFKLSPYTKKYCL
jgi:hypothetical protein